jgi:hypothetical protein
MDSQQPLETYLKYFARKGLLDPGEDRIIGENSSACWEIKVAFDGYGGDHEDDENFESYVIYIHKKSADEDFLEFPEQKSNGFHIEHRSNDEAYAYYWYDVKNDEIELGNYEESFLKSQIPIEKINQILQLLFYKYSTEDADNFPPTSSSAWPFK